MTTGYDAIAQRSIEGRTHDERKQIARPGR